MCKQFRLNSPAGGQLQSVEAACNCGGWGGGAGGWCSGSVRGSTMCSAFTTNTAFSDNLQFCAILMPGDANKNLIPYQILRHGTIFFFTPQSFFLTQVVCVEVSFLLHMRKVKMSAKIANMRHVTARKKY